MENAFGADMFSGAELESYRRHKDRLRRDIHAVPTVEHDCLMVLASMPEKIHAQEARVDRPGVFSKFWTFLTGVPPAKDRRKKGLRDHRRMLARANADAFHLVLEQQKAGAATLQATGRHLEAVHRNVSAAFANAERSSKAQIQLLEFFAEQVGRDRGRIDSMLLRLGRIECRQEFLRWNQRFDVLGPRTFGVGSQLAASWLYVDAIALHCPELEGVDRDMVKEGVRKMNGARSVIDIDALASEVGTALTPIQRDALGLQRERLGDEVERSLTDAIMAPILDIEAASSVDRTMNVDEFVERLLSERYSMLAAERSQTVADEPGRNLDTDIPGVSLPTAAPTQPSGSGATPMVVGARYVCRVAGRPLTVRLPSGGGGEQLGFECDAMRASVYVSHARRSSLSYLARLRVPRAHPLAVLLRVPAGEQDCELQIRIRAAGESCLSVTYGAMSRHYPLEVQ